MKKIEEIREKLEKVKKEKEKFKHRKKLIEEKKKEFLGKERELEKRLKAIEKEEEKLKRTEDAVFKEEHELFKKEAKLLKEEEELAKTYESLLLEEERVLGKKPDLERKFRQKIRHIAHLRLHHKMLVETSKSYAWLLFALSVIGAVGLRFVLIVTDLIGPMSGRVLFYLAVISYIIFHGIRALMEHYKRKRIHVEHLRRDLEKGKLSKADVQQLEEILSSIATSKLMYTFALWCLLSVIALLGQVLVDIGFA